MDPDKHHNALNQNDMLHWYEIKSILGQGGFGITYLARDTNLNHDVAIKEYLPNEYSTRNTSSAVQPISEDHVNTFEWGKARFLDEARTLFQFKHPNIVRVLSFFEFNNTGYMVMEYEEGNDFSDLIGTGKAFDEAGLLDVIVPILGGLELVHNQGFIHRDIKPQNIFIRNDGSPVLIDFGSARQAMGGQTRTITTLVTPGYSPLEQYHEEIGKQGPWTDIYSLGATLYAAITDKPPADSLQRSMARAEHKTDAYLRLTDLKAEKYSEHFLTAIDHALEFVAKNRPQNVSDWSKMLRGVTPVPDASPVTDIYMGPAVTDETDFAEDSRSPATPATVSRKRKPMIPVFLVVFAALGVFAYLQWDPITRFVAVNLGTEAASEQPASQEELEVDASLVAEKWEQEALARQEAEQKQQQELARQEELAREIADNKKQEELAKLVAETRRLKEELDQQAEDLKRQQASIDPKQQKTDQSDKTSDLSGTYTSELTYTQNHSGVDPHWYFGEAPGIQIKIEHTGNEILAFIEGSREGRIEGTVTGNEIKFQFYVVDPSGQANQGNGIWFIAEDNKKMIGQWSLINVSDGSPYLEGDWKLTKLE